MRKNNKTCLITIFIALGLIISGHSASAVQTQSESFYGAYDPTDLKFTVDVEVYSAGEDTSHLNHWALRDPDTGATTGQYIDALDADQYLYMYTLTSMEDESPYAGYSDYLTTFTLFLNKEAPISGLGAELNSVATGYNRAEDQVRFNRFFLGFEQQLTVFVTSEAMPELVEVRGDLYFSAGNNPQTSALLLAPDPIASNGGYPVPEPATLLLVGGGLIGLAGFRKRILKKRS